MQQILSNIIMTIHISNLVYYYLIINTKYKTCNKVLLGLYFFHECNFIVDSSLLCKYIAPLIILVLLTVSPSIDLSPWLLLLSGESSSWNRSTFTLQCWKEFSAISCGHLHIKYSIIMFHFLKIITFLQHKCPCISYRRPIIIL